MPRIKTTFLAATIALPSTLMAQAGTLETWGTFSEFQRPYGAFTAASCGYRFCMALRVNGRVELWGMPIAQVPPYLPMIPFPEPPPGRVYTQISAGFDHAVALLDDGTWVGRGRNVFGQAAPNPPLPCGCVTAPQDLRFHSVSAGEWFTVGIVRDDSDPSKDRRLRIWGKLDNNELVFDPFVNDPTKKFKMAIAGGHNIVVLDVDGNVYTWGDYHYINPCTQPMVSIGPNWQQPIPVQGPGCSNPSALPPAPTNYHPPYASVGAGHVNAWGIRADPTTGKSTGIVDLWGSDRQAQLKINDPIEPALPYQETSIDEFLEVVGGYDQGLGLHWPTLTLKAWGNLIGDPVWPPPAGAGIYWGLATGHSNHDHAALKGCYANCDESTAKPLLNVDDFTCFINEFVAAQALPHEQQIMHYANCDGSTVAPVLNVDDFLCFIDAFALGCYEYPPLP